MWRMLSLSLLLMGAHPAIAQIVLLHDSFDNASSFRAITPTKAERSTSGKKGT